jgi:hypothetical protein
VGVIWRGRVLLAFVGQRPPPRRAFYNRLPACCGPPPRAPSQISCYLGSPRRRDPDAEKLIANEAL